MATDWSKRHPEPFGVSRPSILVIVPTRGRPESATEMVASAVSTTSLRTTYVCLVLDREDPDVNQYGGRSEMLFITRGNMVQRSNEAFLRLSEGWDIIGWAADDNRFLTPGWDEEVARAFLDRRVGMVNTNDLLVGNSKGGAFFVRASVARALGYLLLPDCEHLYVDFAASELFKNAGAYDYLPDVVIEHRHPYAGKAQWDAQYLSVNNREQDIRDGRAYLAWRESLRFQHEIGVIQRCLAS